MNTEHSSPIRAVALAIVIVACAVIAPAGAQNPAVNSISIPATSPFAHTWYYSTCNEWCGSPDAWRVVTPYAETAGPADFGPAWSPDGTWIAFVSAADIAVMAAEGGPTTNLTNTPDAEGPPAWSPDGQHIAFVSNRSGEAELYVMRPDGSDVTRLTTDNGVTFGRPTWSPDSTRLAFDCELDPGNSDICAIGSDGAGFVRLTDDPGRDVTPAWSPDGQSIAFATSRWGLALMRPDGTNVLPIPGLVGTSPAWAPDGRQIAFETVSDDGTGNPVFEIYKANVDGSDVTFVAYGGWIAWLPLLPFAAFSVECSGFACTFDASSSYGGVGHAWDFGDQTTGTGQIVSHTYASGGSHTVVLTVTASGGATASASRTIALNNPPVPSLTVSCNGALTCSFDASASYDPDGTIQRVEWAFGDGKGSDCHGNCPLTISHAYATGGTYAATLRITDNASATATTSRTVTLGTPLMHVGDLDGSASTQSGSWTATVAIEVHDAAHAPVANATVSAAWDKRTTASCTTNATGRCVVSRSRVPPKGSAVLTVTAVSHAIFAYQAAGNHDPDGDSNGTVLSFPRR